MSKSKITFGGEVDPQTRFFQIIDEYFGKGQVDEDLDSLPAEKRLQIMGKFAEFRWGKKQANAEDTQSEVNTTSELLKAIYEKTQEKQS